MSEQNPKATWRCVKCQERMIPDTQIFTEHIEKKGKGHSLFESVPDGELR